LGPISGPRGTTRSALAARLNESHPSCHYVNGLAPWCKTPNDPDIGATANVAENSVARPL